MQSALDTKITLSGDEAVKKAFQDILAVGQKALNDLSASAKEAGRGLDPFRQQLDKAGEHTNRLAAGFEQLAAVFGQLPGALGEVIAPLTSLSELFTVLTTGMGGAATAAAGVIAAYYLIADSAAKATNATADAAKAAGLTTEQFEGLRYAAASVGIGAEAFAKGIEHFALKLSEAKAQADAARKSYEQSLPSLDEMALAQHQAADAAEAAATAVRRSDESVKAAQHSFEAASRALKTAKDNLADLRGEFANQLQAGRGDPALAKRIAQAEQAVRDREYEAQQAAIKQQEAADNARLARVKQLREEQARAVSDRKKAADDQKKQDQDDVSANDKRLRQIAEAFSSGTTANTYKALGELSDQFKGLTNEVDRASLAQSAFGKQWPQFVGYLELGSQGLNKLSEELEKLHIGPSDEEKKAASEWQIAMSKIKESLESSKNAFGNIIGELFTPGFVALAEGIAAHITEIRAITHGLVTFWTPVFRAVGSAIGAVVSALDLLGQNLSKLTGTQISGALSAIGAALAIVAPEITLFVGALTAMHYALSQWSTSAADAFLPLTIGIIAVTKAITALREAFVTLSIAASPWLLLAAAVLAVGAAIYVVYGDVSGLSAYIGQVFGEDSRKSFDDFVKNLREMVQTASAWFKDSFLGRMVSTTIDSVHNMYVTFTSFIALLGALWDAAADSYKNGFLGKFVSGTVEAIKFIWGWFDWLTQKIADVFAKLDDLMGIGRNSSKGSGAVADAGGGGGGGGGSSTGGGGSSTGGGGSSTGGGGSSTGGGDGGGGATTMFNLGIGDVAVGDPTATLSSGGGGGSTLPGYGASSGTTIVQPARGSSGGTYAGGGTPSREVIRFAGGGQVRGPGGIDTVPIRATAGEFVHRVAAVRHYGSAFMTRLNNLQVPKGFALGGLVGGMEDMLRGPRGYAGGGQVSHDTGGGPTVAVALSHGGDTFHVLASSSVADRLVTHSRREQMRSGGRKPDWFGGA